MRDTLRHLAGDAYALHVAPYRTLLQEARRQNEPLAPFVLDLLAVSDNPYEQLRIAAAFVEESESSG